MSVGDNNCNSLCGAVVFGRKSGALAGSTLTLVMSTPDEKVNANPVKRSGHGVAVTEQNGTGGDAKFSDCDRGIADIDCG
jgi:hypothetical protein